MRVARRAHLQAGDQRPILVDARKTAARSRAGSFAGTSVALRDYSMNAITAARVLVVDDREGTLSRALTGVLACHEVERARDAVEAIHRIDCAAHRPFDLIFCDLVRGDLPGPELWAYLSQNRKMAAKSIVFVASRPLKPKMRAFLATLPNVCVELPLNRTALDMLAIRHAPRADDTRYVRDARFYAPNVLSS